MAENKKSFILYADLIHTIEQLPNDKAGELFLHILRYVNDKNPVSNDLIINLAFEPIKQQLKRDLVKWDKFKEKQSENGKLGGRPKSQINPNNPSLISESQKSLNVSVNVNDNVNDNVTVNDNVNNVVVDSKKKRHLPQPILNEVKTYFKDNGYPESLATKFYNNYNENNWHNKEGVKIINWKQTACTIWFKEEDKEKVIPNENMRGMVL